MDSVWTVILRVRDAALEGGGGFGGRGGARANADDVRSGRLVRVPERGRVRPVRVVRRQREPDTRGKRDGVGRKGERGVDARDIARRASRGVDKARGCSSRVGASSSLRTVRSIETLRRARAPRAVRRDDAIDHDVSMGLFVWPALDTFNLSTK